MRRNVFIMFFVFVLFSNTWAAVPGTVNYQAYTIQQAVINIIQSATSSFTSASILLPALILTGALLLSVLYLLGHIFNNPQWKITAADEFWHLLFSIGLLVSFGMIVVVAHLFFQAFFWVVKDGLNIPSSDVCFHKSSTTEMDMCYINEMQGDMWNIVRTFETAAVTYQRYAALYIAYYGLQKGTTASKLAYRRGWSLMLTTLDNMYVLPVYVSVETQKLLIQYLLGTKYSTSSGATGASYSISLVLGVLLPIAIICRFIPILRPVGNFFFALALVIYAFVPFMLAVVYIMYSPAFNHCNIFLPAIKDNITQIQDCSAQGNLYNLSRLYPYAVIYPNFVLVLTATLTTCVYTLLNKVG